MYPPIATRDTRESSTKAEAKYDTTLISNVNTELNHYKRCTSIHILRPRRRLALVALKRVAHVPGLGSSTIWAAHGSRDAITLGPEGSAKDISVAEPQGIYEVEGIPVYILIGLTCNAYQGIYTEELAS